ncbi:MAG: DsbA family oxidoreductase [Rhodospirillales bacterium CG15_BIG_FIL_POST_REV_8_21_14_020_66_15]|nr:MAG: DsbA family oxidoreductase [Rhodospirillales bacterium CG15_BIG_FIL_POST_REV_8_21_14_020_66_15]
MDIEIIYDTVCPWCYIGKRRLDQALALRPNLKVTTHWRPFLLNPELPPDGVDRTAYLVKKFGSETRVRRIYGAIGEAGQSVEIDFAFDRIQKTPNSVDSHRLVKYAARRSVADAVVEALFVAYFVHGLDIGEARVLLEIGVRHGLDRKDLARFLAGSEDFDAVTQDNARAHRLGVNGVPSFVFTGPMVISGAQEPQILARMLDAAASAA